MAAQTLKHLKNIGEDPYFKDGTGYPSFSKLINDCILECPTEIVMICNDRARPTPEQVQKQLRLINEGFGYVGLWSFAFFGFKKELVRKIGFMDEGFVGGNYEDSDYLRRFCEADIAVFTSTEVPYIEIPSAWDNSKTKAYYDTKWKEGDGYSKRLKPEPTYDYDLGPSTGAQFNKWETSQLIHQEFVNTKIY